VDQGKIERALEGCYDAIVAPDTWPEAVHALARALGAAAAMFYPCTSTDDRSDPRDPNRPLQLVPMSPEYVPLIEEYLSNAWYLNHYRAERGFPLIDSGRTVVIEHDLATDEERKRLRPYNELYLRFGFPGYAMTAVKVDGNLWVVPMLRGAVQGHFTREDAKRLAALAPHFARLIRLSNRFAFGQAKGQLDVLDRLACPAFLIDWKGAVIGRNASADALMGEDLRICRGMLMAADAGSNRALQDLVLRLRTRGPVRSAAPPGSVFVRRLNRAPLAIEALPVAGLTADAFRPALAVLVVTDLDQRPVPSKETLRAAFGLTVAEARLASRLASGESLDSAANVLGITKETARSQLKAVFAKTGTSRQADLVALLARFTQRA
jgi:DNA-binding CsgD family transcriptional regulator